MGIKKTKTLKQKSNKNSPASKTKKRTGKQHSRETKVIAISSSISGIRTALLENNQLVEFFWELPDSERVLGNIYLGKVRKIVPGMNAAFVDIGEKRDAFLHFSDTGSSLQNILEFLDEEIDDEADFPTFSTKRSGDITIPLRPGQMILAQAIREPYAQKGIRLTTNLSLPGRFIVLVPFTKGIGISRKISNKGERQRLRTIIRKSLPKGFGCIVRTEAEQQPEEFLEKDLHRLLHIWKQIQQAAKKADQPRLLYRDASFIAGIIRDFFRSDIRELIIDSKKMYKEILSSLQDIAPQLLNRVRLYRGRKPLFEYLGIAEEIERAYSREISLPSGGSVVFDHTEAMLVIDVNTRKSSQGKQTQEAVALRTNLEAAREIAHQLRLRDVGGLIVIDFIDMQEEEHRKKLYEQMKEFLKNDRAISVVYPLTQLSLMQITRQRIRKNIAQILTQQCPTCLGRGTVTSAHLVTTHIENWLRTFKNSFKEYRLILTVHPSIAEHLQSGTFSPLTRLMLKYLVKITLETDPNLPPNEFRWYSTKQGRDVTDWERNGTGT